MGRKPLPNRPLKGRSQNVGLPDKLDVWLSNHLPMPPKIHGFPLSTMVLGAYATPKANTLMPLFLLLFNLIFTASKA